MWRQQRAKGFLPTTLTWVLGVLAAATVTWADDLPRPTDVDLTDGEFQVVRASISGLLDIWPPRQEAEEYFEVHVEDVVGAATCPDLSGKMMISGNHGARAGVVRIVLDSAKSSAKPEPTARRQGQQRISFRLGSNKRAAAKKDDRDRLLTIKLEHEGIYGRLSEGAEQMMRDLLTAPAIQSKLNCLRQDALPVIQRAVRDALPRNFSQDLAWRYGVGSRQVLLRPGTRLCVDFLQNQERLDTRPGGSHGILLAHGARRCWPVGRRWQRGFSTFDAFVSEVRASKVAPMPPGIDEADLRDFVDAIDIASTNQKEQAHYGLLFPANLNRHEDAFRGAHEIPNAPMLVGAQSHQELEWLGRCNSAGRLVEACQRQEVCRGLPGAPADPADSTAQCFLFQEQGMPSAEIRILVNDESRWVPLGTTLGDVLAQHLDLGLEGLGDSVATSILDARVDRQLARWVSLHRRYRGNLHQVRFQDTGIGSLDLPLVIGDQIELRRDSK